MFLWWAQTDFRYHIEDSERSEEAVELSDEIGERFGLGEFEFLAYQRLAALIQPLLSCTTGAEAFNNPSSLVEDILHVQVHRFVMCDPVEAFVKDDKEE